MSTNPLQSHGRGLAKKAGVAFFWALACALGFGSLAWFRPEKAVPGAEPTLLASSRGWIDRLELQTYDWRSRELAAQSTRRDEVVVVRVDDETLSNAREGDRPGWAMQPWPRELSGAVVEQLAREGAKAVVFTPRTSDVSPHFCVPCKGDSRLSDDAQFGASLEAATAPVVVPFEWSRERKSPGERPLVPFLVKLGEFHSPPEAVGVVRTALVARVPAWVVTDAKITTAWAGAATEDKAKELAARLRPKEALVLRRLEPQDADWEVDSDWLVEQLATVRVQGLDGELVPQARSYEAPVPEAMVLNARPAPSPLWPDADGRTRSLQLLVRSKGSGKRTALLATVPLRLLLETVKPERVRYDGARLWLGESLSIPMAPDGSVLIQWPQPDSAAGGVGGLKRVLPAWRVLLNLEDDREGRGLRHHDNELTGRVVVFSDEREEGVQWVRTPVGRQPRPALYAQVATALPLGEALVRAPPETDTWWTVAYAGLGAMLALAWSMVVRRPGWLAWAATLAAVYALHAAAARQIFVDQHRWVAMVIPLLACTVAFLASLGYARALEQGLREFMLRTLGGAVRADVFQRVERNLLLMRPERREITLCIADIEGFTSVAAQQEPRVVGEVLQEYLSEMTDVVLDRGGHVDKYLGDGLMLFWGAPVEAPDHAAQACEAALALMAHFDSRRPDWERRVERALVLRAGLDTGPTLVGEMGTHHRVNYTVLGEPVAAAFRLEGLAKRYGVRVLATDRLRAKAGAAFVFAPVDRVRMGRSPEPVDLYVLLGRAADLADQLPRVARRAEAFTHYVSRRFTEATALLETLQAEAPEPALEMLLTRCRQLALHPPPETWDGVFERRA